MPKQRTEETKKHGDKMETLIERTGGGSTAGSAPGKRSEPQDDPTELQDDDDEDAQNDSVDNTVQDDDDYVEERNARADAEIYEQRLSRLTTAYRMLVTARPRRWH